MPRPAVPRTVSTPPPDVLEAWRRAERLYTQAEVEAALDRMAEAITERLGESDPVVLCVMLGGLVPAGRLVTRLDFPLTLDYVHATRYRGGTKGHELEWIARPRTPLAGRAVLVVDDILDEGVTLAAILEDCRAQGAVSVHSAVLVDKRIGRPRALARADFTGLTVPDRYVFGYGMDYRGYLRNVPGIYALDGSDG